MAYSVVFSRNKQSRFAVAQEASLAQAQGIARATNDLVSMHKDYQAGDSFKVLPTSLVGNLPMVDCLRTLVADTLLWKKSF